MILGNTVSEHFPISTKKWIQGILGWTTGKRGTWELDHPSSTGGWLNMGWSHQGTPLYLSSIAAVNLNREENQGSLELLGSLFKNSRGITIWATQAVASYGHSLTVWGRLCLWQGVQNLMGGVRGTAGVHAVSSLAQGWGGILVRCSSVKHLWESLSWFLSPILRAQAWNTPFLFTGSRLKSFPGALTNYYKVSDLTTQTYSLTMFSRSPVKVSADWTQVSAGCIPFWRF